MMEFEKLSVSGRIEAFDKEHGGNAVRFQGWYWYANGARRDVEPLGALIPPPEDEYELCTNLLRYEQARHAKAVHGFEKLKEQLASSGCPDPQGLDELRQLQSVVGEHNAAVNEAKAKLDNTAQGKRIASARRSEAKHAQEMTAYRHELTRIRV